MKIYTKIVMQWRGDELVTVEEDSYEYHGPVSLAKGGDGGNQYYENLNRLYGIQADQAEELMGIARDTVFPAYRSLVQEAQGYGSEANQELAATRAAVDSRAATAAAEQGIRDDLTSMGINPADQRYASTFAGMRTQGAAQEAAAATGARDRRETQGFARMQDAVSLGMGTPTQATSAANAASNTAGTQLNAYNTQQGQQGAAVGNIVRAGIDLYGRNSAADGGQITKQGIKREPLMLAHGGYVQRLAPGGIVGSMRNITPAAPPPRPVQPGSMQQMAGPAKTISSAAGTQALGKGVTALGDVSGSTYMSAMGKGIQSPNAVQPAIDAYRAAAQQQVDSVITSAIPEAATEEAAVAAATEEAAVAGATEGAVATEGMTAAATGLETGAMIGAAMPWVAGGLAVYGIGSAAGWWADGGKVEPQSVGETGEVDGPGGPKDDLIPAYLSDGEFVMPVGVVKKYGLARLEKMRQEGLEFEQQLGIGR